MEMRERKRQNKIFYKVINKYMPLLCLCIKNAYQLF